METSVQALFCRGTHYDAFRRIGSTFKDVIHDYYRDFEDLHKQFIPFYETPKGKKVCDDYWRSVEEAFPELADEVRGIADGAELPFTQVLLMHLRVEIQTYLGKDQVPECSNIFVNTNTTCALAHNEDTSVTVRGRGYVVSLTLVGASGKEEQLTAYCYPGVVPGNSMGFNKHGLIFSVNALYPKRLSLQGTPRQILNRRMMSAENHDDLRRILQNEGIGSAAGFSANVVCVVPGDPVAMWNFEVAPAEGSERLAVVDELAVKEHYNHFNAYKHLKIPEMPGRTTSSIHRQARADQLGDPTTIDEMKRVLGDAADRDYPIYRTPSATDSGCTVATGVFDLNNATWDLYVDNPWTSPGPALHIKLPFGKKSKDL